MGKSWLLAPALSLALLLGACGGAPRAQPVSDRQATAQAMFAERCKTAGEKIYKTAENVEGFYLMKLRPEKTNFGDQFKLDDPYTGGDVFIDNLLMHRNQAGSLVTEATGSRGYRYVEAVDPNDGKRYRYTAATKAVRKKDTTAPGVQFELKRDPNYDLNVYEFVLERTPAANPAPRYGVTYDDISTHQEREYWIAGSSLKVMDLQTNEVIAERIGYMMDWAQGSQVGGRSPWLLATRNACPSFPRDPGGHPFTMNQVRNFVEKVLHIKQGN